MINALKYVEALEKSGFTKEEAKTSMNIWLELMNDNLASKMDLKELEFATSKEFANVRHEMREEFKNVRHEMREEFKNVRHEMKEEFKNVRHEMREEFSNVRHEIISLEQRLTIKLGLMMATGLTIMGLIQKL